MSVKLVRDLMHIGVTTCPANTTLADAVRLLLQERLESLIVLDDNRHAIGLVAQMEAVAAYGRSGAKAKAPEVLTLAEVMQPHIPEIPPDIPATAAAQIMIDQGVRALYLMHHDGGISWPAAVLRFEDILRYMAAESDEEIADMGAGAARKTPFDLFKERYAK